MGQETYNGPLGEIRAASAAGGTALTTTIAYTQLFLGAKWMTVTPRNLSATTVVTRVAFNPFLTIIKTTDALATAANATDASYKLQDNSTSTAQTFNSFDTAANLNYIYVGSHTPFRGVFVDVTNVNSNASVLTVKYWNGAWTSISPTDGTAFAGATFAIDGGVTWTVPTDWVKASLLTIGDTTASFSPVGEKYYWTRWQVSLAFDSAVSVVSMLAMNRSTNYAELVGGQTLETAVSVGPEGIGCIEALTDTGTANLVVNVGGRGVSGVFQ